MNKKLAVVLAAMGVLGATTAFAANPFSDVTPQDWAYQAVSTLAAQGVIDGYPDGTFKGERNMTRYEMAQMVARAMARQDMANAEQQAQIDRLAAEFANELNSLGVRVSALEDRVGNVKVGGDARVRYIEDNGFDARLRLNFDAKVSDKTNVFARLTSGDVGAGKDAKIGLDNLYVKHQFNGFAAKAGRYDLTLGATGVFFDDRFDGVEVALGNEKVNLAAGYGNITADGEDQWDFAYTQLGFSPAKNVDVVGFYVKPTGVKKKENEYWGAGLNLGFENFNVHGDYIKNTKAKEDDTTWMAGVRFGKADLKKVGSFEIGADYVSYEEDAFSEDLTTLALNPVVTDTAGEAIEFGSAKFWMANASVVPFENVKLNAYYMFNVKEKETNKKGDSKYRIDLNYYF